MSERALDDDVSFGTCRLRRLRLVQPRRKLNDVSLAGAKKTEVRVTNERGSSPFRQTQGLRLPAHNSNRCSVHGLPAASCSG